MREFYVDTGIPDEIKINITGTDLESQPRHEKYVAVGVERFPISDPIRIFAPDKRYLTISKVFGQHFNYFGCFGDEKTGTVCEVEPLIANKLISYYQNSQPHGNYCVSEEEFNFLQKLFSFHKMEKEL